MKIWEMVGLWHYPIPGFFLLAQFCLGILVALGNLVNNSVFLCLSDEGGLSSNDFSSVKGINYNLVIRVKWKLNKHLLFRVIYSHIQSYPFYLWLYMAIYNGLCVYICMHVHFIFSNLTPHNNFGWTNFCL